MNILRRQNHKKTQAKPEARFVGDVGEALDTPSKKIRIGIPLIFFALALGFVLGAVVCALLSLVNALVRLVWETGAGAVGVWWYPVTVCVIGGLACGLWTRFVYDTPASLKEVLGTVKSTGEYHMDSIPKGLVSFLLPLTFGGAVGPEAGLTGIIAVACTRIGSLLSRAGVRAKSVADLSVSATLSAIFGSPFLGAVVGVEETMGDTDAYTYRRPVKVVLYTSVAFGALAGMQVVGLLPGTSSGLPRFAAIEAQGMTLLWALPCVLAGWLLAIVYCLADRGGEKLHERLGRHIVVLPLVCGVVMGLLALVFPDVLFSGEEQIRELVAAYQSNGIASVVANIPTGAMSISGGLALLCTAVIKALLTPLCLNCGWRGGHFFPMIFAGSCLGFAVAAFSGADAMLCVTVLTATLMGAIMRKPLAAGALLLLCFPTSGIIWMALAALIGSVLPVPTNRKMSSKAKQTA